MGTKGLVLSLVFAMISHPFAPAYGNGDLASRPMENIRKNKTKCVAYLQLALQTDDSVGAIISTNKTAEFKLAVEEIISSHGKESLRGATFYVVGIKMKDARAIKKEYAKVAKELNLDSVGSKIKVLSVPSNLIEENSVGIFQNAWERMRYYFPSFAQDFQRPTKGEIISQMASNTILETPSVIMLLNTLPSPDAYLTVAAHASIVAAYGIFKKFMQNWLLKPGSSTLEINMKHRLLATPLILNYNLSSHFTELTNFYKLNGVDGMMAAFPEQALTFFATQALTIELQSWFSTLVITNGVDKWEQKQTDPERTRIARITSTISETPILALNAMALAAAGAGLFPIHDFGPLHLNMGHVGLAVLTGVGWGMFKVMPNILDKTIDWYARGEKFIESVKEKFRSSLTEPIKEIEEVPPHERYY